MAERPAFDEYSPEMVAFWVKHWSELVSASEGGSGGSGIGAGRGGRFALVCLKADLEAAADQLPLHWSCTARIFKRQQRFEVYLERCARQTNRGGEIEQPIDVAFFRMATFLGWAQNELGAA